MGHTQAAAGVAGVIKMVQAMRHAVMPKTLHVDAPSPHVDWSAGQVALLTEARPWPADGRPRRAGVSSFGISGTNAHVIVEAAPPTAPRQARPAPPLLAWVVSAQTESALEAQAARAAEFVRARPQLDPVDVGWSLAGRAIFEHRAVVIGGDRQQLSAGLTELADGTPVASVVRGTAASIGKTVLVFPGQGSQWVGMGVELLDTAPVFAHQIKECEQAFAEFVDWSLTDVLRGAPGAPGLDRVDVVQPALFAMMVSLAELWKSIGVHPDAVIGHSQGEIAAAYVADALSLRDAARVVTLRSKLLATLAGRGGMVSLGCGLERARKLLSAWNDRISIAAVNGRQTVVVSGAVSALDELMQHCAQQDLRARRIDVDYASHSVDVEAIRDQLTDVLSDIQPRSSRIAFFSTVTGGLVDTVGLDADYWYRNIRQTVQCDQAVRTACEHGYRTFIESSPHPALIADVEDTVTDSVGANTVSVVIPTLGRDDGGLRRFLTSAAQAFVAGVEVDWRGLLPEAGFVELPTYAFDRRRFWLSGEGGGADATGLGLGASEHALLGAVVQRPDSGGVVLTGRLAVSTQPWLTDHVVAGVALLAGAAFVEMAIRAGDEVGCTVIDELMLRAPLLIPADGAVQVQVIVGAADQSGHRSLAVYSRDSQPDSHWMLHAEGTLGASAIHPAAQLSVWPPPGAIPVDVSEAYQRLAAQGYQYGPAFQGLQAMWRRGLEIFAEVALPEGVSANGLGIHPVLLDAALHAAGLASAETAHTALPFCWQGVSLHAAGASRVRVRIAAAAEEDAVSIELADITGRPVLSVRSLLVRPVSADQLQAVISAVADRPGQGLLEVKWSPITLPDTTIDHPPVMVWHDLHTHPGTIDDTSDTVVIWERGAVLGACGHPSRPRGAAILAGHRPPRHPGGAHPPRGGTARRRHRRPGRSSGLGTNPLRPDRKPRSHHAHRHRHPHRCSHPHHNRRTPTPHPRQHHLRRPTHPHPTHAGTFGFHLGRRRDR